MGYEKYKLVDPRLSESIKRNEVLFCYSTTPIAPALLNLLIWMSIHLALRRAKPLVVDASLGPHPSNSEALVIISEASKYLSLS